jgi:ABC-type transport system substrate-binding protein
MTIPPRENVRRWALQGVLLLSLMMFFVGCGRRLLEAPSSDEEMVLFGPTTSIRGFDPVKAGDVASSVAISKIYEGLLQYAYLERPYKVVPLLAEELPAVSEDGLVYTFKVRKGIYFQDDPCFVETGGRGRELVAEDFVYAVKRVADKKNASTGYWAYNDRIAGLDAFREASGSEEPTDYDMPVEGLKALDDHTLQITLKRPYPQLLWILTMHYAYAVPREAVEYYSEKLGRKPFINHPVGTGPYKLEAWRRNYRIEFVRNPKWRETGRVEQYPSEGAQGDREDGLLEDAGKPIPFIDRIVQYVVRESSTAWLMFLTGQFSSSGISRDNWDAVLTETTDLTPALEEKGIDLSTTPTLDIYYIGFNMDDPVVGANKKLRQAMTCAFNTEQWVSFYRTSIGPHTSGRCRLCSASAPFPL